MTYHERGETPEDGGSSHDRRGDGNIVLLPDYPPALRAVLPAVKHRRSKYLNNGLERDHQPGTLWVKQRVCSMQGFKNASSASTLCGGHALIQNLRNGFAHGAPGLTAAVPRALRLARAWSQLARAI